MSNYPCIASSVLSVTAQSPNELVTIPDSFRLAHYLQSYADIGLDFKQTSSPCSCRLHDKS